MVIGLSLVNVLGEFLFQSSNAEDGTPIMTAETIEHVAQVFEEHGSIIWWERDAKTSCQKDLPIQVHQMVSSRKKQTSWMYGSTQVHHGMVS